MTNLALIDADLLVWLASYEKDYLYEAEEVINFKLEEIITATDCSHYKFFVGGRNNFRHFIKSDYKAHRTGDKPELFDATKQLFIEKYNAFVSNGVETDDSIVATAKYVKDNELYNPIVCTTDKDYKIKPLTLYSWERNFLGKVIEAKWTEVTEEEAWHNFCVMMLTGDAGDNIKVCKGIGKAKAAKILDGKTRQGMIRAIVNTYKMFYGENWKYKLTETYHLINLIDDYTRVNVPKEYDFAI